MPPPLQVEIDFVAIFKRLCWRYHGRPGTARPSDNGLKVSQFTRIVQARGNLLASQIGEVSQNLRRSLACGQVTQYEADGNPCSLDPRFSPGDFWVAHDVLFPLHGHAPILSPFPCN